MTPETLRHYRRSKGFNVRQMGDYLGVTGAAVSQWENAKHPIPRMAVNLLNTLQKLEEIQNPKLPLPIPEGLCQCGCGLSTIVNWRTDKAKGWIKGKYRAYIKGHNATFQGASK